MNQILLKRILFPKNEFAKRKWFYQFRTLNSICSEDDFEKWWKKKHQALAKYTKNWDDKKQSEWIIRNLLSAKMIMSSTLKINSLDFAISSNLKVVESYLEYYSVLQSMRALILNLYSQDWKDATLLNQNHHSLINTVCSLIMELNPEIGNQFKENITRLKANRELVSYRAPSSGIRWKDPNVDIKFICTIFCELAQVFSEMLEEILLKKGNSIYELKLEEFTILYNPKIDNFIFPDNEDMFRVEYILRKNPRPTNLLHILTEGHVDGFFEAWLSSEDETTDSSIFNPATNRTIIFDLP